MPFESERQKRWMYANKPKMAKEWSAKESEEAPETSMQKALRRTFGTGPIAAAKNPVWGKGIPDSKPTWRERRAAKIAADKLRQPAYDKLKKEAAAKGIHIANYIAGKKEEEHRQRRAREATGDAYTGPRDSKGRPIWDLKSSVSKTAADLAGGIHPLIHYLEPGLDRKKGAPKPAARKPKPPAPAGDEENPGQEKRSGESLGEFVQQREKAAKLRNRLEKRSGSSLGEFAQQLNPYKPKPGPLETLGRKADPTYRKLKDYGKSALGASNWFLQKWTDNKKKLEDQKYAQRPLNSPLKKPEHWPGEGDPTVLPTIKQAERRLRYHQGERARMHRLYPKENHPDPMTQARSDHAREEGFPAPEYYPEPAGDEENPKGFDKTVQRILHRLRKK